MGNRLSKIVTRTGDQGTTSLGDGARVTKDDVRIEAMGQVDELNSMLGVLLTTELPASIEPVLRKALIGIQNDLFDLGGELCIPGMQMVHEAHVKRLEQYVETFNADLSPLKEFILPGGTRAAAVAHLARTICRRTERQVIRLANSAVAGVKAEISATERADSTEPVVSVFLRQYLNRLSDLLFIIARLLNKTAGQSDVLWTRIESR
ncbi:MAG: cob(I)yrinic acid a,c-diamide adenosyltransferase [Pseudomonadota bacterium]